MGIEINPYDPCVSNKMINGSQITATWHMDDLKASHKKSAAVTTFIMALSAIYGNGLSGNRGKVHSYLSMDFDYGLWLLTRLLRLMCRRWGP